MSSVRGPSWVFLVSTLVSITGCGDDPPPKFDLAEATRAEVEDSGRKLATQRARKEVKRFIDVITRESAGEGDRAAVRAEFREGEEVEFLWLEKLTYEEGDDEFGTFTGIVRDPARLLTGVTVGQKHSVAAKQIIDWMYVSRGQIVGGYTLQARMEKNRRRTE